MFNKGGATVYVETDGAFGHTYLEVNNTVFSFGRYDGSYSPILRDLGPVGPGVLLKESHKYAEERAKKSPTTVHQFPNADADAIYEYMNNLYLSGRPASHGGRIISTYVLVGNNCTSVTCNALQIGGVSIPLLQMPTGFNQYMNMSKSILSERYISTIGQH